MICQGPCKFTVCLEQEAELAAGMRDVLELGPEMFKANIFDYRGQMRSCVQHGGQTVQTKFQPGVLSVLVKLGNG